jgi:hypothetical protein
MAVPTLTEDSPGPVNRDFYGISTTRTLKVIAASEVQAENYVVNNLGINLGTTYQSIYGETPDANVVCTNMVTESVHSAPIGGTGLYAITATWGIDRSSEPRAGGPVKYIRSGMVVRSPSDMDGDGNPVLNSADEPYREPIYRTDSEEITVCRWVVSIADPTLNISGFTSVTSYADVLAIIRPYRGALNSASWQGCDSKTAVMMDINATQYGQDDYASLILCEAKVHYKPQIDIATELPGVTVYFYNAGSWGVITNSFSAWYEIRSDRGFREKGPIVGGIQTYTPIVDADGNEIREPVALDGLGARLGTGTGAQPVVRVFQPRRPSKNFNTLGI